MNRIENTDQFSRTKRNYDLRNIARQEVDAFKLQIVRKNKDDFCGIHLETIK